MTEAHQPKFGVKKIAVKQNVDSYKRLLGKNAAFREWQQKLNRGDKLPRGKYFKGKAAGRPFVVKDEAWLFLNGN